jgi:hypothetical protein
MRAFPSIPFQDIPTLKNYVLAYIAIDLCNGVSGTLACIKGMISRHNQDLADALQKEYDDVQIRDRWDDDQDRHTATLEIWGTRYKKRKYANDGVIVTETHMPVVRVPVMDPDFDMLYTIEKNDFLSTREEDGGDSERFEIWKHTYQ